MDALNDPAPTVLRVNTLKTTKEKLIEELQENEIESHAVRGYEDAVELEEKKNVFLTEAFKKGMFEVQDASSQLIGRFLDVKKVCV